MRRRRGRRRTLAPSQIFPADFISLFSLVYAIAYAITSTFTYSNAYAVAYADVSYTEVAYNCL